MQLLRAAMQGGRGACQSAQSAARQLLKARVSQELRGARSGRHLIKGLLEGAAAQCKRVPMEWDAVSVAASVWWVGDGAKQVGWASRWG